MEDAMANILIVDHYSSVRELLMEELVCEGYTVAALFKVESVREVIERSKPDIVLWDPVVEEGKEWDMLRNIKEHHPSLPVLVVTSYEGYQDDPRLTHADGYVIKNSGFDELKQKISHLLRHQQKH